MTATASPRRAPLGNTPSRYGAVAKTFHWTVALAILAMIPLGLVADALPYATSEELALKARLFSVHKTLGVAVLVVAIARIAWAVAQPRPGPLHPERRLETALAGTVHWLLYASIVLMPLSGWVAHAASEGFAPILWPLGQSLPLVPKSEALYEAASSLHVAFAWLLIASVALHVAGALKHHLWDRDATLRRMAPGRPALPPVAPHRPSPVPPVAAAALVAAALGLGVALGPSAPEAALSEAPAPAATAPEAVAPEPTALAAHDAVAGGGADAAGGAWAVEDGRLAIAVTQLGTRVEGAFAEWDARIAFSEAPDAEGRHGAVEASVDVLSLTLGSVTEQALGEEFFAAERFPRAVFAADILAAPEGAEAPYLAVGTLSLRGAEVPVSLPFDLAVEGNRASAEGVAVVDRRDFAIGEGYADPGTLGFEVEIAVALEAVRAE